MTADDLYALTFSAVALAVMIYDRWRIWNCGGKYERARKRHKRGGRG